MKIKELLAMWFVRLLLNKRGYLAITMAAATAGVEMAHARLTPVQLQSVEAHKKAAIIATREGWLIGFDDGQFSAYRNVALVAVVCLAAWWANS